MMLDTVHSEMCYITERIYFYFKYIQWMKCNCTKMYNMEINTFMLYNWALPEVGYVKKCNKYVDHDSSH